jgi:hypothetical protein
MTLEEAAKQFRMPLEALKKMHGEGLLSDPLALDEISNLSFLSYFWGKPFWLRRQLMKMKVKSRLAFVRTVDFSKTEAYVFNRYYNVERGTRLSVGDIAQELKKYYGVPITKDLMRTIFRIRRKAQDARQYDSRKTRDELYGRP